MQKLTPSQKMATAYIILRKEMPYLQTVLNTLVCVETPGLGTLGVTEFWVLMWDPAFVESITVDELAAVLLHEVMHVMQKHCNRFKRFIFGRDDISMKDLQRDMETDVFSRKMRLWNMAADLEINDDIRETNLKLPSDCLFPEKFGLKPNLLAEEYFRELEKMPDKKHPPGNDGCDGSESGKNSDGKGKPKPGKPGQGHCGSCAGNPLPDEKDIDAKEGRSQGEIERNLRKAAEDIKDAAAKSQGNVPGGLRRWAEAMVKPPKIRWQDKLARCIRHSVNVIRGRQNYDRKRFSRVQWGLGVGPGKPILPGMSSPIPNIWFAIDTSGSMSRSELERAVAEADGVLKAVGNPVTFVSCDCKVAAVTQVSNWRDITKNLIGGYGTSFVPVFEEMRKAKTTPDILIFATDGCGDAPPKAPVGTKVIWILVGKHRSRPYGMSPEYGEFIEIDD